ncbi:MAG: hypothetical protein EHM47_17215 [Ignavibacteriales bacterium]|nr:MAG: hypothetical protein EHM47_17215 [Ignavibacteriales bacterium]
MNNTTPSSMFHFTISKMIGDMNFVGIFYIITGALYCLSIIGAVVGIPIIISGLRVRESANQFQAYLTTNDTMALEQAIERQSRFFFIQKVLMIITLVLFVLYIIAIIVFIGVFMTYFEGNNFEYSV